MGNALAEQMCSEDRAKPLRRRVTPGALLDMALMRSGWSKAALARHLGIAGPSVHQMISGQRAITEERMQQFPEAVIVTYRTIEARERGHVYAVPVASDARVDLHEAIARLSRDHSETMQAYLRAYARGTASPGEQCALARELREDIEAAVAVLAAIEGE